MKSNNSSTYSKIIFFDFDGVVFDSINNMEKAWGETRKKFNLDVNFNEYRKHIGLPFKKILTNININDDQDNILKYYAEISLQNLDLIKPFKNIHETINLLLNKNVCVCLYTSKDQLRTEYLLKKFNFSFHYLFFGDGLYKKPNPTPINLIMRKYQIDNKYAFFLGDSKTDYLTAKKAGINFLLAKWGYEDLDITYKIEKPIDLISYV